MSQHARFLGILALPAFLFMGCAPEGQDTQGRDEADAAEAPATQRPMEMGDDEFSNWDRSGDQTLDRQEFGMWIEDEGVFDDWFDTEDNVDRDQLASDLHEKLDRNDDGEVTETDWTTSSLDLFGAEDPGQWSEWDLDADGELSEDEFQQVAEEKGLYGRIDQNGDAVISDEEARDFYFDLFDRNDDGQVDMSEWEEGRSTWFDSGFGM